MAESGRDLIQPVATAKQISRRVLRNHGSELSGGITDDEKGRSDQRVLGFHNPSVSNSLFAQGFRDRAFAACGSAQGLIQRNALNWLIGIFRRLKDENTFSAEFAFVISVGSACFGFAGLGRSTRREPFETRFQIIPLSVQPLPASVGGRER